MWKIIGVCVVIIITHLYTKEQIKQECYQRGWVVFGVNEQAICYKSLDVLPREGKK